jgi:hypothetical protein
LTSKSFKHTDDEDSDSHKRTSNIMKLTTNNYKETYAKYKNAAKEYNIDLFFCDVLANDACIDIAHNLKKPVVGFTSFIHCNYN